MKGLSPAEKNRIAAEKQAEKERIAVEIKSARILINKLFYEKNPEQPQSKKIADIPFEFLDQLNKEPENIPKGISREIFDIIYEKAKEYKKIEDEAAEKKRIADEKKARKKEEKEEKARKKEQYRKSPEGQEKIQAIEKLVSQIGKLRNDIKVIIDKQPKIKLKRGEKPPEIQEIIVIEKEIQDLENKIDIINEGIENDLATMMGGKIKSRVNRKKHIHKITKRCKKIKNKLTKRYKKIKKSKRTRKLV
jgi:hypothetical protein